MSKFTDCMIDFETLSIQPNAVVTQMAWVMFNRHDPNLFNSYQDSRLIAVKDQVRYYDRHLDIDTLVWWLGQDPDTLKHVFSGTEHLFDVVERFKADFQNKMDEDGWLWSKGSNFDEVILQDIFYQRDIKAPYSHRQPRCFRTLVALNPDIDEIFPDKKNKHNAIYDCLSQAQTVQKIFNS